MLINAKQKRMEKLENWYQYNDASRGFQTTSVKIRFYLWKFIGETLFRWLGGPLNFFRVGLLRFFGARIGKKCYVSSKVIIVDPFGLTMGNSCSLDQYVYINGVVLLGNNVSVSSFAKFISAGHDIRSRQFEWYAKPIIVENSAFIGANAVLMGGVKIGTFSVVGANAFVVKSVPENKVVIGNPAQIHSARISAEEYLNYDYKA